MNKSQEIHKGNWCIHDSRVFCQESSGCNNCEIDRKKRINLPCVCIPGSFLCPEALRLWNEVNRRYEEWMNAPISDYGRSNYDQAQMAYYKHFNQEAKQ